MAKKTSGRPQEQQSISSSSAGNAAQTSNGNGNASDTGDGPQTGNGSLSSDEIAARAYEIYEREGRSDGRDMDHWLQAEKELRAERQRRQSSVDPRPEIQRQPNPQSRQELPRSARQHQPTTGV
jgi:hypothetical protein